MARLDVQSMDCSGQHHVFYLLYHNSRRAAMICTLSRMILDVACASAGFPRIRTRANAEMSF